MDGGILEAIGERVAVAQSGSRRLKLGGNGPVQDGVKAVVEVRRERTSCRTLAHRVRDRRPPEKALSDSVAAELRLDPIAPVGDVGDSVILWAPPSTA